jgi:hypothetical protein
MCSSDYEMNLIETKPAVRSWLLISEPAPFLFVNIFHTRHVREPSYGGKFRAVSVAKATRHVMSGQPAVRLPGPGLDAPFQVLLHFGSIAFLKNIIISLFALRYCSRVAFRILQLLSNSQTVMGGDETDDDTIVCGEPMARNYLTIFLKSSSFSNNN